jgi:hypothetical protein
MAGCSSSVTICLKDKESGLPIEGILVERYEPVSRFEKVVNPIDSTYHSFRLAATALTQTNGVVTFEKVGREDSFQIYPRNARPLSVAAWGKEIDVWPETNRPTVTNWGCTIWLENGVLQHSVWEPKD